jgi:hypothetical protein
MILHTASEGISLAKKLETESAEFYEEMAKKYSQNAEQFNNWAKENRKFIKQIEQVYYGVITDALEGSYAFTTLDSDHYVLNTKISGKKDADNKLALAIEEIIMAFYKEAAKQSEGLMADVPRSFTLVNKKRASRIELINSLK